MSLALVSISLGETFSYVHRLTDADIMKSRKIDPEHPTSENPNGKR